MLMSIPLTLYAWDNFVCVCFVVISASCLLSVSEFIFQVQTHGYIIMKMWRSDTHSGASNVESSVFFLSSSFFTLPCRSKEVGIVSLQIDKLCY